MLQRNLELIFSVRWRASSLIRYKKNECDLTKTGPKFSTEICVECNRKLSSNLLLMLILWPVNVLLSFWKTQEKVLLAEAEKNGFECSEKCGTHWESGGKFGSGALARNPKTAWSTITEVLKLNRTGRRLKHELFVWSYLLVLLFRYLII